MSAGNGKPNAKTARYAQRIRERALAYPGTKEDMPWGHSAFKVNGKAFVFMGADDEGLGLSVKLKQSHLASLDLPFVEPTHYGLGKHGWVSASFEPNEDAPLELLEAWIDESYRLVAPKKLVKQLDGAGAAAEDPPARGRRARARR